MSAGFSSYLFFFFLAKLYETDDCFGQPFRGDIERNPINLSPITIFQMYSEKRTL